jgi:hypothetical protein
MSEGGRDKKKVAKERWSASLGKIREGGRGYAHEKNEGGDEARQVEIPRWLSPATELVASHGAIDPDQPARYKL